MGWRERVYETGVLPPIPSRLRNRIEIGGDHVEKQIIIIATHPTSFVLKNTRFSILHECRNLTCRTAIACTRIERNEVFVGSPWDAPHAGTVK